MTQPSMVLVRRANGSWHLIEASDKAALLFGCSLDAVLQPGFLESRLHPRDRLGDCCEVRLKRDDGRYLWVSICFEAEQGALLDVSARRRSETMGRLAAGIAHELNTPVQFVGDNLGFARDSINEVMRLLEQYRALRERVANGEEPSARELAELADAERRADLDFLADELPRAMTESRRGLERVAAMVKAMREFAPSEATVAVDVNRALETALVFTRHEYKYIADIDVELGPVPLVLCHAGELHQDLVDLVLDAARACSGVTPRPRLRAVTRVDGAEVVVQIGAAALRRPVALAKTAARKTELIRT
jgi:signal transduction histidine kinase